MKPDAEKRENITMRSHRTLHVIAMVAAVAAITGGYWVLSRPHPPAPVPKPPPLAATRTPVAAPAAPVVPQPASPPPGAAQRAEVEGTSRMYLAHAPLRTPEVADPNSDANRRILQTMVTKALQQASATPNSKR